MGSAYHGAVTFVLDPDLPPVLAPLAWMIGRWEGAGVMGYPGTESFNVGQEVGITQDGRDFLTYTSHMWRLDAEGRQVEQLASETGYWRPLPGDEVELLLVHSAGFVELYYGTSAPAKVELSTDGVLRSPQAEPYTGGHRLYGLVNSHFMWAMDKATTDQPLTSHVSAELRRVG